ncbi:unnamed protein product [Didymodactylos carnosus]|uniref:Ion transport domain-containing protein n=1 Tax=Didymodactylos carnosus TaxID=1234261 RepID=A0A814IL91_9BILA|nr:unnamed protein product [Didymodactylos carnosus]CAF1024983.1 unnamed protein product [Didymodactylos carnosus]CAF3691685.1 unnamed protein product [Didymodactylos carnosus]CAF3796214.1 unnamed protein product [Didymodactylos carnosus]
MIGMECFKDKIQWTKGPTQLQQICNNSKLNNSAFASGQYCRNNFNDYFSALIVLFELTVVNQWHVIASGFVLVTSKASRLFFMAFHISAVIVVLNIFTAFVLDSFLTQYVLSRNKQFPWTQQEQIISDRLKKENYVVIRRYGDNKTQLNSNEKFNLIQTLKSCIRPIDYRQQSNEPLDSAEDKVLLVRWTGNVDIDPSIVHLTQDQEPNLTENSNTPFYENTT